ncbi:CHAT domain-containing protein [Scytonema sp. UIC 10036]|uniref:nSTAND1 domain-containing NTPase n=1 Tax=Scytonema sp. UIC 10036 TaxID=2304196 RepID=UPI0012DA3695|nr:CHAT domain-containing protein [Scytonema sp. UIC 10036]MUG92918.1 CHAT domain-containing protein [Scytonema sp. UIC 10036]
MTKLVVLKLDGDLHMGVRVTLSISYEGISPHQEVTGRLPPVPQLQTTIDRWRSHYRSLGSETRALKAIKVTYDGSITQKYNECKNAATELQKRLNKWLFSESFRPIRETWLKELKDQDLIRVLIRTSNPEIRQIPWHLWDLVEEYPNAELALSAPDYHHQPTTAKTPTKRDKVKILAILGNSTHIDVETDRKLLNSLPDADVTFLVQPQRHEINDSLWSRPWDILFFAGHSQTVGESGRIYINQNNESLTIDDLKYGLRQAVRNGLPLAIFNSCDGLGLASSLEALQIPQILVMREPVPDEVAQAFLKYFLVAYAADGNPLYQAVKEARLKLHGLEDKYPCASLLPVICQNVGAVPPSWLDLGRRPTQISPYRGLFAFREEDAQFFFGREAFTKMLVDAVERQPMVAVIGPSGCGKSSVVFAGLVKHLRNAGNWHIVEFRPGSRPMSALATALLTDKEFYWSRTERLQDIKNLATNLQECNNGLRDVVNDILRLEQNKRLLLVADQFEELYTLCRDSFERKAFLDELLEAINTCQNFTFVLTLRADFLGQVLSYRPFADALQYADLKLGPMTEKELLDAVDKPAALLGVTVESGLTGRILSSMSASGGDLPLLEFALTQLWSKQQDAQLTHTAYDEIGGVEAALARYADEVYNQLNFEEQERAQRIFIQLVHPGQGTEDTRRVATRCEVGEENWDLVTRLASSRLVVTGYDEKTGFDTVELVHEALIRSWGQLNLWMQLDRDFRHWQEQLRSAMRTWESSGFDEGALLRGKPLADAEDWLFKRFMELSSGERSFIGLSLELRSQQRKKQKRRRQFTVIGLSFGLILALILAGVAGWQWQNSVHSEIQALSASSEALFTSNQQLEGLTEAIKAGQQWKKLRKLPWIKTDTQTTVVKALENVLYKIKEYNRLSGHKSPVDAVAISSQGSIIATASQDKTVKLWKPDGTLLNTLKGHDAQVYAVAFSPDSQIIASGSEDKTIKLWKLDGTLLKTLKGHSNAVKGVTISPNGKMIASASWDGTIKLWKLDGTFVKTITPDGDFPQQTTVAFSSDSEMIASGGWDGTVKFWKLDGTLQRILEVDKHKGEVYKVAFSTNGEMIATASDDKTVKLWRISDGKLLKTLEGHNAAVRGVAFSFDDRIIASVSDDTTVKLWKPDGTLLTTLLGHSAEVYGVAFSPDNAIIATASEDKTVKLWKPSGTSLKTLFGYSSSIYGVSISPDGKLIATVDGNKDVKLWNRKGNLLKTLKGHSDRIFAVTFSPDSQIIASAGGEGTVKLWKTDGTLLQDLHEDNKHDAFRAVAFSHDGEMIASAGDDTTVKLWKLNGKLKILQGHSNRVWDVSFSNDKQLIASASEDGTVKLWKPDGTLLNTMNEHDGAVYGVAISPDSKIIASASENGTVKLWNKDGTLQTTIQVDWQGDAVKKVTFNPVESMIATASKSGKVELWNLDGTLQKTLDLHKDEVTSISFSHDGKTLASASKDKSVILWNIERDLNLDGLLKLGCNWGDDYIETNSKVNEGDRSICD